MIPNKKQQSFQHFESLWTEELISLTKSIFLDKCLGWREICQAAHIIPECIQTASALKFSDDSSPGAMSLMSASLALAFQAYDAPEFSLRKA